MDYSRTVFSLNPIAQQAKQSLGKINSDPVFGFFGLEKKINDRNIANNKAFETMPDEIRVTFDVAKQCLLDELSFKKSVRQIYNGQELPRDLLSFADLVLTGSATPQMLPLKIATTFVNMLLEDHDRHGKLRQSIKERHEILGPILCVYALCEDKEGYYLKKASWKTHKEWIYSSQDTDIHYFSLPDTVGIHDSVNVDGLLSNHHERGL